MISYLQRFGAVVACLVLAACGGGGGGGEPPPTAEDLQGFWIDPDDAEEEPVVTASSVSDTRFYAYVFDTDFEGQSGRYAISLSEVDESGEERILLGEYYGSLSLDGDQVSARLHSLPTAGVEAVRDTMFLLTGVFVDKETLSLALEPEDPSVVEGFGVKEVYLNPNLDADPTLKGDLLDYAGVWEADGLIAAFLNSDYQFRMTFPSDTGEGFGIIEGGCDMDVKVTLTPGVRWAVVALSGACPPEFENLEEPVVYEGFSLATTIGFAGLFVLDVANGDERIVLIGQGQP